MSWGLQDVTVRFGGHPALTDIDLSLPDGTIASIVGADGAGKTTLTRVMVGLIDPSSGMVIRPDQLRIGYQSEASGVWTDLTVSENLDFVAAAHGLGSADRKRMIDQLLDVTRLGGASSRLAGNLSGGMRQKLGVAMAMLPRPELIVLDEPTTGLDPVSRSEVWTLIAGAAADGAAVVSTTTYLDEAERGDQVMALDMGVPLASGTVAEVRAATPGALAETGDPDLPYTWRRGRSWRTWFPDGVVPPGVTRIDPDLSDLVTIAAYRRREMAA